MMLWQRINSPKQSMTNSSTTSLAALNADYKQVYNLLKKSGLVDGNPDDFSAISSDAEVKKVSNALGKIFDGDFEIGNFREKENVYWLDGKLLTQGQIVGRFRKYVAAKEAVSNEQEFRIR